MFSSIWTPVYLVYFANIGAVVMSFAGAAYVAWKTVDAAVDFNRGLYFNYGAIST